MNKRMKNKKRKAGDTETRSEDVVAIRRICGNVVYETTDNNKK